MSDRAIPAPDSGPQAAALPGISPDFAVRMARGAADLAAAQRLRYRVFVDELGGDGPLVDHVAGLERDRFDAVADHLLLIDRNGPEVDAVVGVYRLMDDAAADRAGQFYCDDEYDLAPLRAGGRRLLELGRSCIHPAYRGGAAMVWLWQGLAAEVQARGIDILFGVASFHGTDVAALAQPLSLLHHGHLAPPDLRVRAREFQRMDLVAPEAIDRRTALLETPALIKAYLRLGGFVGEGAFVDRAFNTTDVCLLLDTGRMNAAQAALYTRDRGPA
jgi:putative hemolysin